MGRRFAVIGAGVVGWAVRLWRLTGSTQRRGGGGPPMTSSTEERDQALQEEVEFWRSRFDPANPHSHRFQRRLSSERRFQPYLEQLVAHLPAGATVRVLDVGSGPLTQVGTRCDRWRIDVTAVDPLADEYRRHLGSQPRPAVATVRGEVERLTDRSASEAG